MRSVSVLACGLLLSVAPAFAEDDADEADIKKETPVAAVPVTGGDAVEANVSGALGDGAIVYEDNNVAYCIGGVLCPEYCGQPEVACEARDAYSIRLPEPARIGRVQVYAHDQIGQSRRADLVLKINGEIVDRAPVYRAGSTVSLEAGRVGQVVTIEAMHNQHGFERGGDEAVIREVFIFQTSATDD